MPRLDFGDSRRGFLEARMARVGRSESYTPADRYVYYRGVADVCGAKLSGSKVVAVV